ncbi:hypothetical protein [Spirochaeta dissipatitropha]
MATEIRNRLNKLMEEKNYLAAILLLREIPQYSEDRQELPGLIAERLIEEIDSLSREKKERRLYLRSLLQMLMREVPGLAAIYRDQVRASSGENDPMQQVYKNVKNWSDVASGKKSFRDGVDDTAENVQQGFEQAGESIRSGEFSENLKGFFNVAEQGIQSGLKTLDSFFQGSSVEKKPQENMEDEYKDAVVEEVDDVEEIIVETDDD